MTSAGSPWRTTRRPPRSASRAARQPARNQRRLAPAGFQSRSSTTNSGITPPPPSRPSAIAAARAWLSARRRSRRNHMIELVTGGVRSRTTSGSPVVRRYPAPRKVTTCITQAPAAGGRRAVGAGRRHDAVVDDVEVGLGDDPRVVKPVPAPLKPPVVIPAPRSSSRGVVVVALPLLAVARCPLPTRSRRTGLARSRPLYSVIRTSAYGAGRLNVTVTVLAPARRCWRRSRSPG